MTISSDFPEKQTPLDATSDSDRAAAPAALQQIEGEFEINEKLKLFEQIWLPVGGADENGLSAKATVVIVHGFGEHSGRYLPLAKALVNAGYAVYAYDQRGHGKSGGPRAYINAWDEYVTDFEQAMTRVLESSGDLPLFLFGHSMGGLVVASYLIKHKDRINHWDQPESIQGDDEAPPPLIPILGVVFSSALLVMPNNVSPLLVSLSGLLSALVPKMKTIKVDPRVLSRDPQEVEKYMDDPLVFHDGMPVRTGYELRQAVDALQSQMVDIDVPFFVFHGSHDRLTEPQGSELLYFKARSMDKTHKVYIGGFHEMLNSPERKAVIDDILAWLDARVK